MNWTGGSLQRSKNAKKGILQKQKAFFARARTHLQNASKSLAIPFRPSYLCDDDEFEFNGQMSSFGSGSVRHTGHSTREQHGEWESVTATNLETQQLEANRKRLLRQQDWVGIDPSKPVHLQLLSNKGKYKFGKRRTIRDDPSATARIKTSTNIAERRPQPAGDAYDTAYLARAIETNVDNVHVRIGTDALTTTFSTQLDPCIQSQASSDPMLFDQERRDTDRARQPESVQPVNQQRRPVRLASWHSSAASYEYSLTDEIPIPYRASKYYRDSYSTAVALEHSSSNYGQFELNPRALSITKAPNQTPTSVDPGYRITHHVERNERPLRLFFENTNFPVSAQDRIATQNNIGEAQYVHQATSAGASQKGYMPQVGSDNELSIIDEGSAALAIVDEEPWKTFLAISDGSSSHSAAANEPGNSLLRSDPTILNNEAVTNWSQRTTQGDQTRSSSSRMSASLPSLKRGIEKYVSERASGARHNSRYRSARMKTRGVNEDERLWQAFVFGSDNDTWSESHHDTKQGTERIMSTNFEEGSSRYLPLSIAVSPVSSTPFRSISGLASCISDNVQDAAAYAPPPGSRAIISPALPGSSGNFNEGQEGDRLADRKSFGQRSVTHASMQNNASCHSVLFSSKFLSDTKTSRSSLDPPDRTRDMISTRCIASTRKAALSPFSDDIPVSYDESSGGLDLVDPSGLS
ncbi:Nn.00g001940.m01.CDS01 [Neocucurbitaria sp. VM-36]